MGYGNQEIRLLLFERLLLSAIKIANQRGSILLHILP